MRMKQGLQGQGRAQVDGANTFTQSALFSFCDCSLPPTLTPALSQRERECWVAPALSARERGGPTLAPASRLPAVLADRGCWSFGLPGVGRAGPVERVRL